jgi:putative nucleotidyltransferase with HDIG domain
MEINCTPAELKIFRLIGKAAASMEAKAFVTGGFVRDKILHRATKDMDIVTDQDGILLAEKCAGFFEPAPMVNVFKNFGTAQIKLPAFEIEFVGARKESYLPESRKPTVTKGTLEEDQHRRDFTINTMAISLQKENFGELIDPFNGLKDVMHKIIRTPLEPEHTFSDDPLRMLRAIRFAAQLNFQIDTETFQGIVSQAERIRIISAERVAEELNKILLTKKPSIGFLLLMDSGLLQIIFPEMTALKGAEYIDNQGHKDNFLHTLQVVDNICHQTNDLWTRWAALLHDIAKPKTKRFEKGKGFTFHGHEVAGAKMVPRIFERFKLPLNEKMRFVQKLVLLHLRPISLTKENISDSAIRRLLFDAGDDYEALMILCNADITSKNKEKVKRYLNNFELVRKRCKEVEDRDHIRNWQPPIKGEEIMELLNLSPGKPVGILKTAIKDAILDGYIENSYEAAFAFLQQRARALKIIKE